jgi:hypothetical protein
MDHRTSHLLYNGARKQQLTLIEKYSLNLIKAVFVSLIESGQSSGSNDQNVHTKVKGFQITLELQRPNRRVTGQGNIPRLPANGREKEERPFSTPRHDNHLNLSLFLPPNTCDLRENTLGGCRG